MKPSKSAFSFFLILLLQTSAAFSDEVQLMPVKFDLAQMDGSKGANCAMAAAKNQNLLNIKQIARDEDFIRTLNPAAKVTETTRDSSGREVEETYYLFPVQNDGRKQPLNDRRVLGMTQKEALMASRDDFNHSACNDPHKQGDMANRWCHTAIAMGVSNVYEKAGASPALASVGGTVYWALKEKLADVNADSGDLVYSYEDSLGTKRSKFRITIFGDSIVDRHFKKFQPFKSSTPFISFTRKLGPSSEN